MEKLVDKKLKNSLHRIIPHSRYVSIRALNPALAVATGDNFVVPQIRQRGICETSAASLKKTITCIFKNITRNILNLRDNYLYLYVNYLNYGY
jgi:hypothetical protein